MILARKRLTITEIDSVGAVDEPDNPPASLLFFKRRARTREAPDSGEVEKGVQMDSDIIIDEAESVPADGLTVEEPVEVDKAADVEKAADPVEKALEDIAKAQAERDAALAQLAEEVGKRLDGEWVEKARPYELLLGSPEQMGPAMRKIAAACPDEWQLLETALNAGLERADLAKILTEVGENTGSADPLSQRDLFVKDMLKQHPKMTEAEARAAFWAQNPAAKKALREGV